MRDDDDVLRELERLGLPADAPQRPPLRVLSLADLRAMPPRSYLWKGLIAPAEMSVWWGQPKAGKTFLVTYAAFSLAQGRRIFGRHVRACDVLYCACEGTSGIAGRLRALEMHHGDAPRLHVIAQPLDLLRPDADLSALITAIQEHGADVVVLDTLNRIMAGADENSSADMGTLIRHLDQLRQQTGAHVALIHHGTKTQGNGPRGHSSLLGAADLVVEVRAEGGQRSAIVTHAKDDPAGAVLPFTLRVVELDTDADGDAITTCVAVESDAGTATTSKPKLRPTAERALAILSDVIAGPAGAPLPQRDGFPDGLRGASEAAWWRECESRRLSAADTPKDRNRVRREAVRDLQAAGLVAARDGWWWITRPTEDSAWP